MFICEASNRLAKNECRLPREVHATLAQTLMQRVVLLSSYAFVAEKLSTTNFLKLEFDKIAQKTFDFHGTGVKYVSDWYNMRSFKPFLSGVILTREEEDDDDDDDDDGEELAWERGKTRAFLFS